MKRAREKAQEQFGRGIYVRGLLEISSYCKNNCYYCGIRRDNRKAGRYRMSREEILDCCRKGREAGFRTFVLQGGEDPLQSPQWVEETVRQIRKDFSGLRHYSVAGGTVRGSVPALAGSRGGPVSAAP